MNTTDSHDIVHKILLNIAKNRLQNAIKGTECDAGDGRDAVGLLTVQGERNRTSWTECVWASWRLQQCDDSSQDLV